MSQLRQMRFPQASHGVGLVEVLIGILVLAIGLLGVAALQATTLRNSQGAMERSQATFQTYSILDAMRANSVVPTVRPLYAAGQLCGRFAGNTGNALVDSDLLQWTIDLEQLGRNPTSSTTGTCAEVTDLGGGQYQITVQWQDERGISTQMIQTVSQL